MTFPDQATCMTVAATCAVIGCALAAVAAVFHVIEHREDQ